MSIASELAEIIKHVKTNTCPSCLVALNPLDEFVNDLRVMEEKVSATSTITVDGDTSKMDTCNFQELEVSVSSVNLGIYVLACSNTGANRREEQQLRRLGYR